MEYKIAEENGREGHCAQGIQAQINLGLKQGYAGFVQEKKEVMDFLTDLYKEALTDGRSFLPFVVTESVITYAFMGDDGPVGAHEPALLLTSNKSPLYAADQSEEDWKIFVEGYAKKLAEAFKQFRVYVSYTRVETKIFQQC